VTSFKVYLLGNQDFDLTFCWIVGVSVVAKFKMKSCKYQE